MGRVFKPLKSKAAWDEVGFRLLPRPRLCLSRHPPAELGLHILTQSYQTNERKWDEVKASRRPYHTFLWVFYFSQTTLCELKYHL